MDDVTRALGDAVIALVAADPAYARRFADALAPHLPDRASGWLAATDAVAYLGLGSLDALDRAVSAGLPYVQPNGPGGRRYFRRDALDRWMTGGA